MKKLPLIIIVILTIFCSMFLMYAIVQRNQALKLEELLKASEREALNQRKLAELMVHTVREEQEKTRAHMIALESELLACRDGKGR